MVLLEVSSFRTKHCFVLEYCVLILVLQGLFVPFARVGSGDPVRLLCLLQNEYTGCN